MKDVYFDKYDGIYAEILKATKFDESTDLSTTYLGKPDMTRDQIIKAEEKFLDKGTCMVSYWTIQSVAY